MKMMDARMMNNCRRALSPIAGVDKQIKADVVKMMAKTAGMSAAAEAEVVNSVINECERASEDFMY